jgi:hypothetical protein
MISGSAVVTFYINFLRLRASRLKNSSYLELIFLDIDFASVSLLHIYCLFFSFIPKQLQPSYVPCPVMKSVIHKVIT